MMNPSMQQSEFQQLIERYADVLSRIRAAAHDLHASVNQTYGNDHPYGYHLDMVVDAVRTYGHYVCASADDVLPLFFGAYFHDSIEDARLTYNDVTATARHYMSDAQAFVAAEIVYALTNDKGRTRAERAGERYYQGIRATPYAPFVKMADQQPHARGLSSRTASFSGFCSPCRNRRRAFLLTCSDGGGRLRFTRRLTHSVRTYACRPLPSSSMSSDRRAMSWADGTVLCPR